MHVKNVKDCDIIGIDPELVVPDTSRSIYDEAIAPWRGAGMRKFHKQLIENAFKFDFPIHKPYFELSEEHIQTLGGNSYFTGINKFFKKKLRLKIIKYKIVYCYRDTGVRLPAMNVVVPA